LVDSVYVDNAAQAHLLAAGRLQPGSVISGKAYFISQGEPRPLWDLINMILEAAGVPPVTRHISPQLAYAAGWFYEKMYLLLRKQAEPPMTRFLARELSTAHWFDISAARRDLGYEPEVSFEEGISRLAEWLATQNMRG
jgi:nucleoside-diphosphate-sugar epimerase